MSSAQIPAAASEAEAMASSHSGLAFSIPHVYFLSLPPSSPWRRALEIARRAAQPLARGYTRDKNCFREEVRSAGHMGRITHAAGVNARIGGYLDTQVGYGRLAQAA